MMLETESRFQGVSAGARKALGEEWTVEGFRGEARVDDGLRRTMIKASGGRGGASIRIRIEPKVGTKYSSSSSN